MSFGASAHSYVGGLRYSYVSDLELYIKNVMSGEEIVDSSEKIDRRERASEYLMLGLRTSRGISSEEYREIYPASFSKVEEKLRICESQGWAVHNAGRWSFTPQGFLLSNILIAQVLDAQTQLYAEAAMPWNKETEAAPEQMSFLDSDIPTDTLSFVQHFDN